MADIYGQLVSAQLDNLAADPGGTPPLGQVWFNTTTSLIKWYDGAAIRSLAPVTTKGDLQTFSTVPVRLAVGTNGQLLSADSTQATGLKWLDGVSSTLSQYNLEVGNASNVRTAAKTDLLGNVKATTTSQTYAVTSAAPGVFTITGHGFLTGDKAYVTVTQNGFTANTTYWVHTINANTFHLSTTYANAVGATYATSSGTTAGTIVSGGLVVQPGPATSRGPTIQKFLSSSGTYTTPANVAWIRVRMVGGGGGGGGGGVSGYANGTNGTDTTFGGTTLVAGLGGAGACGGGGQGPGGTATINSPAIGVGIGGANGGAGTSSTVTGVKNVGGQGGGSALGGAGAGGNGTLVPQPAIDNTGSGGGGGGTSVSASAAAGGDGGGSGAYIDAVITSPAATYAYVVGAAGTGGAGGSASSGTAGTNGGSGIIIVEEYYF